MQNSIDGRLWLSKSDHSFLGKGRIELLERIDATGSISKAAKEMKMGYKAAWDALDAMNNLAEEPLVERIVGGKGGGGTSLTPYAKKLIDTYKVIHEEHERFLNNLSLRINDTSGHLRFIDSMSMRVSARNQLLGRIVMIHKGSVHSEVVLKLSGGDTITAVVTNESIDLLDLRIDLDAYALFKSSAVMLGVDTNLRISSRNRLEGKVSRISEGSVNSEVIIELKGANTLCATLTNESLESLGIKNGSEVIAFCKASSVILGLV
ncbi:MAG: TOBE domain-containing protein [Sulfurimonadaceae bacterium]|jgi:molybdate transport system regulatory protein|nr:TOBE domain-containing protein [Sulfurimonadaceae bacterium]